MKLFKTFFLFCFTVFLAGNVYAESGYSSSYELIQWGDRGEDTFYCLDICDENWNPYPGLQAIECGENLHSWSPKDFINNVLGISDEDLNGFSFNWKVWSRSGYGGENFQGSVVVGTASCQGKEYLSTYEAIQWGCRGEDTFYCADIYDSNWNLIYQGMGCGEGNHSYSPKSLDLASGVYYWKIWSKSGYGEDGFWGEFSVDNPKIDTCDSEHLNLCNTNTLCSLAGGYWYNYKCNSSPEPKATCKLTCSSSGFTYTCGSGSSKSTKTYCYRGSTGYVETFTVTYGNGHSVYCSSSTCGGALYCSDDTGSRCTIY